MDPLFLIAAAVGVLARLLVVWALRPWREERLSTRASPGASRRRTRQRASPSHFLGT